MTSADISPDVRVRCFPDPWTSTDAVGGAVDMIRDVSDSEDESEYMHLCSLDLLLAASMCISQGICTLFSAKLSRASGKGFSVNGAVDSFLV